MTVKGPYGGRVEALWFDAAGNEVDGPADAVYGEVTETLDDGGIVMRTYVDRSTEGEPVIGEAFSADLEMESQDGPKNTWDVRHGDQQELVQTHAQLRESLGPDDDDATWRTRLAGFLALPMWDAAPQQLKDEAYAWLVETRPH